MKIITDHDKCVGAGNCVQVAPKHFSQDKSTGIVEVLDDNVPPADVADVEEAVMLCPVAAIRIQAETGTSSFSG